MDFSDEEDDVIDSYDDNQNTKAADLDESDNNAPLYLEPVKDDVKTPEDIVDEIQACIPTAPRMYKFTTNRVSRPVDIPEDSELTLEKVLFTPPAKPDPDRLNASASVQLTRLFYINYFFSDTPSFDFNPTSSLSRNDIITKVIPFSHGQVQYNKIDDEASPSYHSKGPPSNTALWYFRDEHDIFNHLQQTIFSTKRL